ncbi:MAG: DUF4836 family protein [Ginsengibacter sp.]
MKTFLKLFIASGVITFLFSSCKKTNEAGRMIPKNALFVAQVNIKSMDSKLSWAELQQTAWYKKAYSDSSAAEWRKKILENPSASGIDFDEGLIFFGAKDTTGYYIAAAGKLKNINDFEAFNKNFDPSQVVLKTGNIHLLILKDKNVVGWNDKDFIYVMNPATTSSQLYKWNDSTGSQYGNITDDRSADLAAICKTLFSLKSSASLVENEQFSSLLKEKGDVHVWQNNEEIIKSAPSMGMLSMIKLDAFTRDNIFTYTIDFNNGKIDISQKIYVSKELSDVLKKYMGNSINKDMIKNIPSTIVFGIFAFNFKPEGFKELIKLTGTDGLINTYTQQMGFNLDEISKATNSDWLLAFSDFKMGNDSLKYKNGMADDSEGNRYNMPEFNYIFSVGIGDKSSLQKIINAVAKIGALTGNNPMANYVMNNKTFAVGNTTSFANQYLSGSKNEFDFMNKFSDHPVGFFLDIHQLLSGLSSMAVKDPNKQNLLEQSLKTWKNITTSGGEFMDNGFRFHTEINFIDQQTNALKLLNNYLDEIYKISEARKQQSNKKLDSLLTPPPSDTVRPK